MELVLRMTFYTYSYVLLNVLMELCLINLNVFHMQKQCTWAPELNDHVKRTFEVKFADRLRDMFHAVTHRMNGKNPRWMIDEVHKDMMDVLKNDDTYKKRSEQNKKNRRGGSMDNVVEPTHYQGSISAV